MNIAIDELTLGQIKEISRLTGCGTSAPTDDIANAMLGKKVIIRTYSAGVWFGTLDKKSKNEVILTKARRMYRFFCKSSISLSAVALDGIIHNKSKICAPVDSIWLEAIEILPTTPAAQESLETAPVAAQT